MNGENQGLLFVKSLIGTKVQKQNSEINGWLDNRIVDAEYGSVSYEYVVRNDMLNLNGTLHGGIMATMIDDLMGLTVFSLGERAFFATLNLTLDYFAPISLGEKVIAKSKVIKHGHKVINIECHLINEDGKIALKSSSNMIRTSKKLSEEYFIKKT